MAGIENYTQINDADIYDQLNASIADPQYTKRPTLRQIFFASGLKQYHRQERTVEVNSLDASESPKFATVTQIGGHISIATEDTLIGINRGSNLVPNRSTFSPGGISLVASVAETMLREDFLK